MSVVFSALGMLYCTRRYDNEYYCLMIDLETTGELQLSTAARTPPNHHEAEAPEPTRLEYAICRLHKTP